MREAVQVEPDHPVLIDQYLENAVEVDVDALCDQDGNVVIGGLMDTSNLREFIPETPPAACQPSPSVNLH